MKVHELVSRFGEAEQAADLMAAAREVLEGLRARTGEIEAALAHVPGKGGNIRQVFYRGPRITLLKAVFPARRRTPPHDHAAWAQILLLSGREKNTLYRREGGTLRKAGERTLEPGEIIGMLEETVHVVECIGDAPTVGLHVYGGDILELSRRMWHPETLEEHPLDWSKYDDFARAAARLPAAPLA